LARCFTKGISVDRDLEKVVQYYQRPADKGNAAAQCNIGCCFLRGTCVTQDIAKAAQYFELSADA
jgi:TPR repeat protein